ncbi:MAG TPA: archease [Terriglobales bacterium]|nr:archease [Terriglobales bacterium]
MYEVIEHTADIGLRVSAATLEELFAEAGRGLLALVVENPEAVEPRQSLDLALAAAAVEYLLFDWLAELLRVFDSRHLLLGAFQVQIDGLALRARASGETADPARHRLLREIKAITYHRLSVARVNGGWRAEFIVDI